MKTLPYDTSGRTRGGVSFVGTRVRSGASGIETLGSTTRSAATAAARSRLRDFEEASALPSPGAQETRVPPAVRRSSPGRTRLAGRPGLTRRTARWPPHPPRRRPGTAPPRQIEAVRLAPHSMDKKMTRLGRCLARDPPSLARRKAARIGRRDCPALTGPVAVTGCRRLARALTRR